MPRLTEIVTLNVLVTDNVSLQTACKGVLYGTGRQIFGALILFISYYVLALPIGIPLMFLSELRTAGQLHTHTHMHSLFPLLFQFYMHEQITKLRSIQNSSFLLRQIRFHHKLFKNSISSDPLQSSKRPARNHSFHPYNILVPHLLSIRL